MPFDPNFPPDGADLNADEFRAQFNALDERIDGIPAGPPGPPGPPGADGADGQHGADGQPGEVSSQMLNDAIAGTARNPTGLPPLDTPFADPDAESLRVFCNSLRSILLRPPT